MNRSRKMNNKSRDAYLRLLNRVVLGGVALFIPVYFAVRLTGGEAKKLANMSEVFSNIKNPIIWSVPEGGVRYVNYFQGVADTGNKFVLVDVEMEARMRIGFPVVPRCFRLVDNLNTRYYPRSHSPFFIAYGDSFYMAENEVFNGKLLFEIPADRKANNLLFDRYKE
jgi:hypothetical protein